MQTFQALSIIAQSGKDAVNDAPYGIDSPHAARPEPVPAEFIKREAARMIDLWTRHRHSEEQRASNRIPIDELFLPMDTAKE